MTFDEASVERSKSFVKSLQELKNLRPQLYSAAGYWDTSYLHNEQKQTVLDNLKNYAGRALVNAVDHLGTVAYRLTDLFEQQMLDVSTMEMKISCLNQQAFACQAYGDTEGLGKLQMSGRISRHHKHYTLPNSGCRGLQSSSQLPAGGDANPIQAKPHSHASGKRGSKTLSWHLASEANSAQNEAPLPAACTRDAKSSKIDSEVFHLLVAEEPEATSQPLRSLLQAASGNGTSDMISNKFNLMGPLEDSKSISAFQAFDNPSRREICKPLPRGKSLLSTLFAKTKTLKARKISVS
ncbi:hypothetical protein MUK42_04057 [Musa troglodytarum]|uniref:Protein ABIL1 n=2 Tax=Musa troglodytarum TaxID=320322 RepID=A0A9E7K7U4_9LILI|nr:hypothetical protein MUK42_04057 [Musa troglodytarum]